MEIRNFIENKFSNVEDITVEGCFGNEPFKMGSGNKYKLNFLQIKDNLAWAWSVSGFESKHDKAASALIDSYADRENLDLNVGIVKDCLVINNVTQDIKNEDDIIAQIEKVVDLFLEENELLRKLGELKESASVRDSIISQRVTEMKQEACFCENEGCHDKAMDIFNQICERYLGYDYMSSIGYLYVIDKETPFGRFPFSEEYRRECQKIAFEKGSNILTPEITYNLLKDFESKDYLNQIIKVGQERGTWNLVALHQKEVNIEMLKRIAFCYDNGIGCDKNSKIADLYVRLANGERQEVFKEMLECGFEPVFDLMTEKEFYQIKSLDDLKSFSEEIQRRYLIGENDSLCFTEWFVPLVNSLNEKERDFVLAFAKDKFVKAMAGFNKKISSGEIEIINDWNKRGEIVFEENGYCKTRKTLPHLENLVPCKTGNQLENEINKYCKKI